MPPTVRADETVVRIVAAPENTAALQPVIAAYVQGRPTLAVQLSPPGAGGVISKLLRGDADAVVLSRPVSELELTLAQKSGKPELRGYPFALEGVAVVVHPANPLNEISLDQIGKLLGQSIVTWQQLGIVITGTALEVKPPQRRKDAPPSDAQTLSPIELLVPGPYFEPLEWLRRRSAGLVQLSPRWRKVESEVELMHMVRNQPRGLSFTRLPVPDGLKVLAVRDRADAPGVFPNPVSVSAREYPLTHYVYIYTLGAPSLPARDFIAFLLGPNGQRALSSDEGMQPIPMMAMPGAAGDP